MLDIIWCQKRHTLVSKGAGELEGTEEEFYQKFQPRTFKKAQKNSNETHEKHQKSEIKGKEVLNGHTLVVGDLDGAGEELYPRKISKKQQ